jgi:hypothetical protein
MVSRRAGARTPAASAPPDPAAARGWQAAITGLGLNSSAPLLRDLVRPLGWLGAQALIVLQPTLALLGAGASATRLIAYLEALDHPEETVPHKEDLCQ